MATTASGSVWNPDNVRDVAESTGVASLSADVVDHITRDIEFRVGQILEEALKVMRHSKRTTLFTQDVSQALKILDQEPLYGYGTTRPLRFGEASLGPGQPLFYLEDEEVDFEKLINSPLPKVPREITFTAHWLAIEGVQPTIPQNPTPSDARNSELLPKGPGANPHAAATAGADNLAVKPLVKHVLSKELQLYFDHVRAAILDESNAEYRAAAFSSLRADPGLHQLVPYFVYSIADQVTHNLPNIFILQQMMHLVDSLLDNPHLHMAPYIASLVPLVLTCLIGKRLGPTAGGGPSATSNFHAALTNGTTSVADPLPAHYALREHAANLLAVLTKPAYADATPTIKPRIVRTLLKDLLSPTALPLGAYFGVLRGLREVAGGEGIRVLLLPHLPSLNEMLAETQGDETTPPAEKERKKNELAIVLRATVDALGLLEDDDEVEGDGEPPLSDEEMAKLVEKTGGMVGQAMVEMGRLRLARGLLGMGEAGMGVG